MHIDISIFYSGSHFHSLLSTCLRPFFRELKAKQIANFYFVFVGDHRGDHLKVSLQVAPSRILELEQIVQQRIVTFVSANASPAKATKLPPDGLFVDYPNNTVKYNLTTHIFSPFQSPSTDAVRATVSRALVSSAGDCPIDENSLFTLCLYLQLSFLEGQSKIVDCREEIGLLYDKLFKSLSERKRTVMLAFIAQLLQQNGETFDAIREEVYRKKGPGVPAWLRECEFLPDTLSLHETFERKFILFNELLFQHLGMSDPNKLLVSLGVLHHLVNSNSNHIPTLTYNDFQ